MRTGLGIPAWRIIKWDETTRGGLDFPYGSRVLSLPLKQSDQHHHIHIHTLTNMATQQTHRASTFAPVNIAVIKYVDTNQPLG